MQRNLAFIPLLLALPAIPMMGQDTAAQPPTPQPDASIQRFEIGAVVADFSLGCVAGDQGCPTVAAGAGGSFNLNRRFSLDANFNFMTSSTFSTNTYGGRLSEYLFGARFETRAKHYGYFIRAQPGWVHWNHIITSAAVNGNQIEFTYGGANHFVTYLGTGFEYSPTSRIHVRAEAGDLLWVYGIGPYRWYNSIQTSAGVYVGLGKPVSFASPAYDGRAAHRFFDPTNDVLVFASALAWTADSITTHRAVAEGWSEGDPFARPFVKFGWPGQIAGGGLEMSSEVLAMYGAHRIHKHWIERLIPAGVATVHGVLAYENTKLSSKGPPTY